MIDYSVEIIRSTRKTVAVEIMSDLRVVVRAPQRMKDRDIRAFVTEKSAWIEKHLRTTQQKLNEREQQQRLTDEEILLLTERAKIMILQRVQRFAPLIGVDIGKISIRHQRTRWGSCSAKGSLSFNCLLMLCPEPVLDYVVVHELCHLRELNHSQRFWELVAHTMPEFKAQKKWLKDNGAAIICRLG